MLRKRMGNCWGIAAAAMLSMGLFTTLGLNSQATEQSETEDNGSAGKATKYIVNEKINGQLDSSSDIDWYVFSIDDPGTVSITFEENSDKKDDFQGWRVELFADDEESVWYTSNKWTLKAGGKYSTSTYNLPKGDYYIKVAQNNNYYWQSYPYSFTVNYESSVGKEKELEDNDTVSKANTIETGVRYSAKLDLQKDIDWYQFSVDEPGKMSITFEYESDKGDDFQGWHVQLFADDEETIRYINRAVTLKSGGGKVTTGFDNIPKGNYYIKVSQNNDYYYQRCPYFLTVNYESTVGDNVEQESNNTASTANSIVVGEDYSGNISLEKDLDWYTFELSEPSDVSVVLSHDVIDNSSTYWNVRIFDNDEMKDPYLNCHWAGNKEKQTSETTPRLSEGKYYVLIDKSNNWSSGEYTFSVNATPLNLDCAWFEKGGKNYWYEGGVRQGTYGDAKGVIGDGTVRGREICDNNILDANGNGTWFWLDSVYDGAKAVGKEVWMPYIYQDEANWDDATKANIAAESDYGMEGMGRCVLDAINNKSGKWVRYDNEGKMLKGWVEIKGDLATAYPDQKGNIYYYDTRTGLMAKGWVKIDGKDYFFDETTGVLQK